jgi:hypothetical protein
VARPAKYRDVLRSERWQQLRAEVGRRQGWRCALCGRGGVLEGHHRNGYDMLGAEKVDDVLMLCARCHGAQHGRRGKRARDLPAHDPVRGVLLWIFGGSAAVVLTGVLLRHAG